MRPLRGRGVAAEVPRVARGLAALARARPTAIFRPLRGRGHGNGLSALPLAILKLEEADSALPVARYSRQEMPQTHDRLCSCLFVVIVFVGFHAARAIGRFLLFTVLVLLVTVLAALRPIGLGWQPVRRRCEV